MIPEMAAGGLTGTGSRGEDYAIPGWNALLLQTTDPDEFVRHFHRLRTDPKEERTVRRRGTLTAARYAWSEIIRRNLLPHVCLPHDRAPVTGLAESGYQPRDRFHPSFPDCANRTLTKCAA